MAMERVTEEEDEGLVRASFLVFMHALLVYFYVPPILFLLWFPPLYVNFPHVLLLHGFCMQDL